MTSNYFRNVDMPVTGVLRKELVGGRLAKYIIKADGGGHYIHPDMPGSGIDLPRSVSDRRIPLSLERSREII